VLPPTHTISVPLLESDRLIGRLYMKADRKAGVLDVKRLWLENGVKPSAGGWRGWRRSWCRWRGSPAWSGCNIATGGLGRGERFGWLAP